MSILRLRKNSRAPIISGLVTFAALFATASICAAVDELTELTLLTKAPAEKKILAAIKAPELSVVHLWAPWCSNCQAELKSGGWLKMVKDNPQVKFYFVSVWNDGGDGKSMLSNRT